MHTDADARVRPAGVQGRTSLRKVAVPSEHGGWGLTLEPALLGLVIAPSTAGAVLAAAAVAVFVCRTPLKLALIDRRRGRRLPRTALAEQVAVIELLALVALAVVTSLTARGRFWVPMLVAAPVIAVELRYEIRSRSRALVPELAGAVAIGSVSAAIVLADGGAVRLAAGAWLVVSARGVGSVPFVRSQLRRAKDQPQHRWVSDIAQLAAVVLGFVAVSLETSLLAGLIALTAMGLVHALAVRRQPPAARVLGIQQALTGLIIVTATAAGVITA